MSAYAYLIGWRFVRLLPERLAYRIFEIIGDYFFKKNGKSIKRLRSNMQMVSNLNGADLEDLTKEAMRSYMRYWCETFRLPDWSKERIIRNVELVNAELLTTPLDKGNGIVVALPHSGNWDQAAAYFLECGYKAVTVAERLKPERVFQAFLKYREDIGLEVLSTDMRTLPTLVERAKSGYIVALVADRDLSSSGQEVKFFDKVAKMPVGPVAIARKANVDLIGAFIEYTTSSIRIHFKKLDLDVQSQADFFEEHIRRHPVDWHMLQRIWIND